jgi:hypothetical protein
MNVHDILDGDIRQPVGPGIARFVEYWAERRQASGRPPLLASIRSIELAAMASSLVVFDAEPYGESGGFKFRCREMGARHRDFVGTDLTGKTLEEIFDHEDARFFSNIYWGVLTTGRPHYWRRPSAVAGREFETYERAIAPVEDPARPLGTLIGVWHWTPLLGAEEDGEAYRPARTATGAPSIQRRAGRRTRPTYRLIVEAGRFPLAKDCAFEAVALKSADAFIETLRPVLEPIWRGLATRREPTGAREIALIEPSLAVSVTAELDAVPLDRFDRFVNALRPRLEELRAALAGARAKQT